MSISKKILNQAVKQINEVFSSNSVNEIGDLKKHIIKIQLQIAKEYNIFNVHTTSLCDAVVSQLIEKSKSGCLIVMRHGEQLTESVKNFTPENKKILQMREHHNLNDDITPHSAIEFIANMVIFKYLQYQFHISFTVESSINLRAKRIAETLGNLLDRKCHMRDELNCINYPESNVLSDINLKKHLEQGTLSWTKASVDGICGSGRYDKIVSDMKNLYKAQEIKENHMQIMITHTQQINAFCQQLYQPIERFSPYGFVSIDRFQKVFISSTGVITNKTSEKTFIECLKTGGSEMALYGNNLSCSERKTKTLSDSNNEGRQLHVNGGSNEAYDQYLQEGGTDMLNITFN